MKINDRRYGRHFDVYCLYTNMAETLTCVSKLWQTSLKKRKLGDRDYLLLAKLDVNM